MIEYILYDNNNDDSIFFIWILKYLHFSNIKCFPIKIITNEFPSDINKFPSIKISSGYIYHGLNNCVSLIQLCCQRYDLFDKTIRFKNINPHYSSDFLHIYTLEDFK